MQGGSELGWKMSGPVFSKKDDSTPYSSINVLAVGIRGCIFPYFGTLLFSIGNVYYPLILGGVFCLSAGAYLWKTSRDLEKVPIPMP